MTLANVMHLKYDEKLDTYTSEQLYARLVSQMRLFNQELWTVSDIAKQWNRYEPDAPMDVFIISKDLKNQNMRLNEMVFFLN
ncbi:MAG: hypothetical protein JKY53_02265 [Flavobacteriales bacterium]|nr:hypothetical protein [Flavobacteriales bacterium]